MAYQKILWKDRIVTLDDNGNITNVIQEGTPLSAFNLNHMEEGIVKAYNDSDLIKKNQLELLIARDLEGARVTMDEGFWFNSLKDEAKVSSKSNINVANNKLSLNGTNLSGNVEFKPHDIGFKTNKTTYYHKRKSNYATLNSASDKTTNNNTIDVVAEIITIKY
jgi:hypothetical protein